MKKSIQDLRIVSKEYPGNNYVLLKITTTVGSLFSEMLLGQFTKLNVVEI